MPTAGGAKTNPVGPTRDADPLIAAPDAVHRRDPDRLTLGDCWRWFVRQPSIWRGHRLHHYENEHYSFGVTSTVGDRLLRTAPDQAKIGKSGTARTLGVEVP